MLYSLATWCTKDPTGIRNVALFGWTRDYRACARIVWVYGVLDLARRASAVTGAKLLAQHSACVFAKTGQQKKR